MAIVPARGGSKGLPGKNIMPLNGKPLIGWTIGQAKASRYIDELFVSTDSPEIASVAGTFGAPVPTLRPAAISGDESPSSDFILHTLELFREQGRHFDYILLLEPTSPLRKPDDIDRAIETLFRFNGVDGIISVGEVHMEHPSIVKRIDQAGLLRPYQEAAPAVSHRQMLDKAYFPYGVLYMLRCNLFMETKTFYSGRIVPYIIERWQNYEIDDLYDFLCIEAILKHQMEL